MKNPLKFIPYLAVLLTVTLFVSCSSDDDVPTLDVADFNVTVDENQSENTELGTVGATGTDGVFTYSITNQSPAGSIAIDAATGKITVADASSFDFETNPSITATISVMGNSITTTASAIITLNDIDDLAFLLSDSQAAYAAAADGDWVLITEAEYNTLATNLNSVSSVGTAENLYTATPGNTHTGAFTVANDAESSVPADSYVFAFKYYLNSGTDVTGFKIKQSETINDAYTDLGNPLPVHSGTSESVFFILKGNSSTLNSESYIAFYKPSGVNMGYFSSSQYYFYADNDVNTSFSRFGGYLLYQGLSTTQKQW